MLSDNSCELCGFETVTFSSFLLCSPRCLLEYREEVGPDAARKFLGHTQWLVNYWLLQNSFSIGIGDTIADASTMEAINKTISEAKEKVKNFIRDAQEKKLEAEPGQTMMEAFEKKVNEVIQLDCLSLCYIIELCIWLNLMFHVIDNFRH